MFAQSVITDGNDYETHILRAYDSTRAYSLVLISDSGQKASVGMMFTERNDSFDFIAGLEEFKKTYRGEKITLKLNGISDSPVVNKPVGMGLKKLAPPPGQRKPDVQKV